MHLLQAIKVLSPLDVVVLTLEESRLLKKQNIDDCVPASFLFEKADRLISVGNVPTRNVTYWNVSQGQEKDKVSDWQEKLISELSNSKMNVEVQDLDNTKDIVKVSCEVYMIVHNCEQLTKELLKDVKCARVHTAFGPIEVEL